MSTSQPQAVTRSTGDGAVELAAETLRRWMASGRLAPGQRLVEPDLTSALGVSRTSLRAAFRTLASEGLVVIEQYKGASVKRLSRRQIEEVFEAREMLEGLAARRAASRLHGTQTLMRLTRLMAEMRQAAARPGSEAEYARMNGEFHGLIVTAAESEYLAMLVRQTAVPAVVRALHQRLLAPQLLKRSLDQHEAIFSALQAGESGRAEESMRRHIRDSLASMDELPDEYF